MIIIFDSSNKRLIKNQIYKKDDVMIMKYNNNIYTYTNNSYSYEKIFNEYNKYTKYFRPLLYSKSYYTIFKNNIRKSRYLNTPQDVLYNILYSYFIYNKYYSYVNIKDYHININIIFIKNNKVALSKKFNCRDYYKIHSFILGDN